MTFATALDAVTALATRYTKLSEQISGMACASDHDRSWGPADDKALDQLEADKRDLTQELATALVAIARDHRDAWHGFLVGSVARLDVLTRNGGKSYLVGESERDRWTQWTKGTLPVADYSEWFARGVAELAENRELIDLAIRDKR